VDAVLNWLWQGCLVALAVACGLRASRRSRAHTRYIVCWTALATVLVLPLASLFLVPATAVRTFEIPATAGAATSPSGWRTSMVFFAAWTVWSTVFAIRLALALAAVRRARRRCRPFPAAWAARLRCWREASGHGRCTVLVMSNRVRTAAVLSCGSPVIAVAPVLVRHLDADELDRVVVHEWAHVQRRDDLANIVQLIVRVIAGWHPAIWWIERRLQIEREVACDEATVAVTGSPKRYAACLAKLASLPAPFEALPAPGALSSPALAERILRIVTRGDLASAKWSTSTATIVILLLCTLSFAVSRIRIVRASHSPAVLDGTLTIAEVQPAVPVESAASSLFPRVTRSTSEVPEARVAPQTTTTRATQAIRVDPTRPDGEAPGTRIVSGAADSLLHQLRDNPVPVPTSISTRFPGLPDSLPGTQSSTLPAPSSPSVDTSNTKTVTPWGAAADAGIAVGEGSKKAGVAAAGFFSRFGGRIAGSF